MVSVNLNISSTSTSNVNPLHKNETGDTRKRLGPIRQFHQQASVSSGPQSILLIFPHAGSGASAYRALSELFSNRFRVLIMQYPARQDRAAEPAAMELFDLANEAFQSFLATYDSKYREDESPYLLTVFGHSMGAIVAFEFVRLAEKAKIKITQLVVSAAAPPSQVAQLPAHPTDDESLLAHLMHLEGTDVSVMGNSALLKMALPALRADYQAFDRYHCGLMKIKTEIKVVGGSNDPAVPVSQLYGWAAHGEQVSISVFNGGHFYLYEHGSALLEIMGSPEKPMMNLAESGQQ